MRDRLIELMDDFYYVIESITREDIENIADKIIADGWMRPPCKVGDIIYTIFEGKIEALNIIRATTEESTERFNRYYDAENKFLKMPFAECHIGKTVFLTREQALAKMKEGGEE